jgi:hypothetical protein
MRYLVFANENAPGGFGFELVPDDYQPQAGEVLVDERPDPETSVWDPATSTLRPRTTAEQLAEAKALKEAELRDAADSWYQRSVRSFEGAVVIHKIDRGLALNAEEQAIRDAMNANYQKLKNLIGQVRDPATDTVAKVEAISWT